jgi:hypothetical protein
MDPEWQLLPYIGIAILVLLGLVAILYFALLGVLASMRFIKLRGHGVLTTRDNPTEMTRSQRLTEQSKKAIVSHLLLLVLVTLPRAYYLFTEPTATIRYGNPSLPYICCLAYDQMVAWPGADYGHGVVEKASSERHSEGRYTFPGVLVVIAVTGLIQIAAIATNALLLSLPRKPWPLVVTPVVTLMLAIGLWVSGFIFAFWLTF